MEAVTSISHYISVYAFAALLGWAALSDYRTFRIPNAIPLAVVAIYPAYVLSAPLPVDWIMGLAVGGAVLLVTALFFAFGKMGGGDVKLLSAAALWAGPEMILPLLLVMALAGGAVSATKMAWLYFGRADGGCSSIPGTQVPYGIAIAAGGGFVALRLMMV